MMQCQIPEEWELQSLVLYSGKYGILLFLTVYKILISLENPVRKVTNFQGCVILLICNLPVDMT